MRACVCVRWSACVLLAGTLAAATDPSPPDTPPPTNPAEGIDPAMDQVFHFNFTDWHGWEGTGIYSSMYDRDRTRDAMRALVNFYMKYEYDIDISGAFGLFLLKINLQSSLLTLRAIFGSYVNMGQADYIYGIGNDTVIDPVAAMLRDVTGLLDRLRWRMIARVPRNNVYRKIAEVFLRDENPWRDNLAQYDWFRTLHFPWRVASDWPPPDLRLYRLALDNATCQQPDINVTNLCLGEISEHPIFHIWFPQRCQVHSACYAAVEDGADFGFALSHRLLLMIFAHFGRNCYYRTMGRDRRLLLHMCEMARLELDFLAQTANFQFPGLMMEFISFCSLYGYREFVRRDWMTTLRQFQSRAHGCFASTRQRAYNNDWEPGANKSWWTLVRGDEDEVRNCDRHVTGLAASLLGSSFRAAVQPAYCSAAGYWSAIYQGYRYCYFLPNTTKALVKTVPIWIKHTVLYNHYLQYHEGGPNDKVYEVYPNKVSWWQELPWLPQDFPGWLPWNWG